MNLNYEFTVGKRLDSKLVYTEDKHLFSIKAIKPKKTIYECYIEPCSAKIVITGGTCSYVAGYSTHIHGIQEKAYEQFKFEEKVKSRVSNGKEKGKPREIFYEESAIQQDASEGIQYDKRRRNLTKLQSKDIPPNPMSMDSAVEYFAKEGVISSFGMTLHKSQPMTFYHGTVNLKNFGYTIFASENILKKLPNIRRFRIDGTFRVVPNGPYKQLLVISVEIEKHSFPCIYVLMTRKTKASYVHLFKKIEKQWKLNPTTITTDFEVGLRNAFHEVYSNARLLSCWFHFCQAIRRKATSFKGFLQKIRS